MIIDVGECDFCQEYAGEAVIGEDRLPPLHPSCRLCRERRLRTEKMGPPHDGELGHRGATTSPLPSESEARLSLIAATSCPAQGLRLGDALRPFPRRGPRCRSSSPRSREARRDAVLPVASRIPRCLLCGGQGPAGRFRCDYPRREGLSRGSKPVPSQRRHGFPGRPLLSLRRALPDPPHRVQNGRGSRAWGRGRRRAIP